MLSSKNETLLTARTHKPMKNTLELFLITYNRKEKCHLTLQTLLAEDSPVRDLPLTILDNASTDGTSEMLVDFAQKHSNIRLIRHTKNIGGNANIARCFEMAKSKYVWVLCDDDKYDFSNWKECEQLLAQNPPAIVVANYKKPEKGIAHLFRQLSFVPAAIYRTDFITSDTLINMHFSISNLFPQLAVAAAAVNVQPSLPILKKPLVTMQINPGNDSYLRGTDTQSAVHPLIKEMFWSLGYLRSIQMLQDSKVKRACAELVWAEDYSSFFSFCKRWRAITHKHFFVHYFEAIKLLHGKAKWKFMFFVPFVYFLFFYSDKKGLNICLFGFAKTRIWKYRNQ